MDAILWILAIVAAAVIGGSLYASRKPRGGSYERDQRDEQQR
jgi:hypothetical protein